MTLTPTLRRLAATLTPDYQSTGELLDAAWTQHGHRAPQRVVFYGYIVALRDAGVVIENRCGIGYRLVGTGH